jgi:hypothetical protein
MACNTTSGDKPLGVESRIRRRTEPKAVAEGSPTTIESGGMMEEATDNPPERSSKIEIFFTRRSQTRVTPRIRRTHHHGSQMKWQGSAHPTDKKTRRQTSLHQESLKKGFGSPLSLAASAGQERL